VDTCPTCGQPRCGVDATGPTCPLCDPSATAASVRPSVPPAQQVLRALLASALVAAVAAPICSEYVEAGFLQYVVPLATGVLCGAAGLGLARSRGEGRLGLVLRLLTAVVAVVGVGAGFSLESSQDPVTGSVWAAYALAVAGALTWTQPPRRKAGPGI
jgi:hypothetical protein